MDSKAGTPLGPTDPLFTDHQEAIIAALGGARRSKPNIDLPCLCRFDGAHLKYFVSDGAKDGKLYGVVIVEGEVPKIGYFSRSELMVLKRAGQLERVDLMNDSLIVHEVGRLAIARFYEAREISVVKAPERSKLRMSALCQLPVQLLQILALALRKGGHTGQERPFS